jgi:hypothetical protein
MPSKKNEVIVDLTNYKDKVGSRVPEGRYRVVVEDAEPDTSKNNNPMVNIWLRIQDPDGDYDGLTIVDRLTMTDKSLFRVVGFMQAIGLPTPKKRFRLPMDKIIGKHLEVDVADGEPYNNRIKSEVRGYLRLGSKKDEEPEVEVEDDEEADLAMFTEGGSGYADETDDLDEDEAVEDDDELDEVEDEEELEEDEAEPEPEPAPKKKAVKKAPAKKSAAKKKAETPAEDPPEEVDLDELDLG